MDEGVGAGRRHQAGQRRAADVDLEDLGALEIDRRRDRVEADHLLHPGMALERPGQLGTPMAGDPRDQDPSAAGQV